MSNILKQRLKTLAKENVNSFQVEYFNNKDLFNWLDRLYEEEVFLLEVNNKQYVVYIYTDPNDSDYNRIEFNNVYTLKTLKISSSQSKCKKEDNK